MENGLNNITVALLSGFTGSTQRKTEVVKALPPVHCEASLIQAAEAASTDSGFTLTLSAWEPQHVTCLGKIFSPFHCRLRKGLNGV